MDDVLAAQCGFLFGQLIFSLFQFKKVTETPYMLNHVPFVNPLAQRITVLFTTVTELRLLCRTMQKVEDIDIEAKGRELYPMLGKANSLYPGKLMSGQAENAT